MGAGKGWMCISLSEGAGKGGPGRVDREGCPHKEKKLKKEWFSSPIPVIMQNNSKKIYNLSIFD